MPPISVPSARKPCMTAASSRKGNATGPGSGPVTHLKSGGGAPSSGNAMAPRIGQPDRIHSLRTSMVSPSLMKTRRPPTVSDQPGTVAAPLMHRDNRSGGLLRACAIGLGSQAEFRSKLFEVSINGLSLVHHAVVLRLQLRVSHPAKEGSAAFRRAPRVSSRIHARTLGPMPGSWSQWSPGCWRPPEWKGDGLQTLLELFD